MHERTPRECIDKLNLHLLFILYTACMRQRIENALRLAGLREEETKMYVKLLALKRATMAQLIAETGMNVMTAYRTMKRLQERGLVQAFAVNHKQSVFAPLTLRSLISKLDADQRTLRRVQLALQNLDRFLPYADLDRRAEKPGEETPIEVREGLDAFREEYLKIPDLCDEEFLHIGSMQNYWKIAGMSDEAPEEIAFRHKRFRRNIYCRIFNTHSPESVIFAKRDSKELRTSRLVDALPVTKDYLAYSKDDVRYFMCDEENPRVIIMRHPELVALYRDQFERMWKQGVGT